MMKKFKTRFLSALILFSVSCLYSIPQVNTSVSQVKVAYFEHFNFSDRDKDAQNWNGMYIASNNKIYIGLCTHGDAANVYEFDISSKKMRHLANLTEVLNERGRAIWTNGKIHVRMQELDGYVYFGSFCEDNGPPVIDAGSYQGPYWFSIRMSDGHVKALSKINSFWGLLGQDMDKSRRIIYGLAEDGHFYRYFIDKNYTEDLGRVDVWDICRTIFIDDNGNVYGSYPPGNLWKYDVNKERIYDLEYLKLPVSIDSRTMANPMLDRRAQWRTIEWDPVDKAAYGIVGGSNMLFRYDVNKGPEGEITPLGTVCAPSYRNGKLFNIPMATLAMAISQKERKIYYIPVTKGDFDYGQVSAEKRLKTPTQSFLVSYNISTGEIDDLGILKGKDGRMSLGMGAAAVDREGKLWFVGAFEELNERYVAGTMSGVRYSMGLGCYDPFNK